MGAWSTFAGYMMQRAQAFVSQQLNRDGYEPVLAPKTRVEKHATPRAPRRLEYLALHGERRLDEWHWMRDRNDGALVSVLREEDAYFNQHMFALRHMHQSIVGEQREREGRERRSIPVPDGPYEYFTLMSRCSDFKQHMRRRTGSAAEELVVDTGHVAAGHQYCEVQSVTPSPNHALVAFAVDTVGDEIYSLHVNDIDARTRVDLLREHDGSEVVWCDDSSSFFYCAVDCKGRPWEVCMHTLHQPQERDIVIKCVPDERLWVTIKRSGGYLLVGTHGGDTVSWSIANLGEAASASTTLLDIPHNGWDLTVLHCRAGTVFALATSTDAPNGLVCVASAAVPGCWDTLVAHDHESTVEDFLVCTSGLVVRRRSLSVPAVTIYPWSNASCGLSIDRNRAMCLDMRGFGDAAFEVDLEHCDVPGTVRYTYQSMRRHPCTHELDLASGLQTDARMQRIEATPHIPGLYRDERIMVASHDGCQIPVSMVFRDGLSQYQRRPCVIYAYGAYGVREEADFVETRISLLDRGIVCVVAHCRGGSELGQQWHAAGRLMHKRNGIADLLSVAEHMAAHDNIDEARIALFAGSAGAILAGAAMNERADLFRAIVLLDPFVDVLTSMCDASLRLTCTEFVEWGDPVKNPRDYHNIMSYSPYDNVRTQPYPSVFVGVSMNDGRVPYWEGLKFVQKLRSSTTSGRPIILRVNAHAGHMGPSCGASFLSETAEEYAFLVHELCREDVH